MIPGHEIAGVIKEAGKEVKKFKVGDVVGVGCFVNSCKACTFEKNAQSASKPTTKAYRV